MKQFIILIVTGTAIAVVAFLGVSWLSADCAQLATLSQQETCDNDLARDQISAMLAGWVLAYLGWYFFQRKHR